MSDLEYFQMFQEIECSFLRYFHFYFAINENINHCTLENKIYLLNIIKKVVKKYNNSKIFLREIIIAVLLSFYALILLELSGDNICLEEICQFINLQPNKIDKTKEIYYGIIWGDDPILSEVRVMLLFPERLNNL
jgi:hypothetical protein